MDHRKPRDGISIYRKGKIPTRNKLGILSVVRQDPIVVSCNDLLQLGFQEQHLTVLIQNDDLIPAKRPTSVSNLDKVRKSLVGSNPCLQINAIQTFVTPNQKPPFVRTEFHVHPVFGDLHLKLCWTPICHGTVDSAIIILRQYRQKLVADRRTSHTVQFSGEPPVGLSTEEAAVSVKLESTVFPFEGNFIFIG